MPAATNRIFSTHSDLTRPNCWKKSGSYRSDSQFPSIDFSRFPVSGRLAAVRDIHPKVVIHLGAGNRFRDGALKISSFVITLSAKRIPVFFIGHNTEEKRRAGILSQIPGTYDFFGIFGNHESLQLIAGAAVYVGADSGPLHVASLTATPLVAIYGPNLAEISGPWRKANVEIIHMAMSCRPCSQRKCKYDTIPCMQNISVEKVFHAVNKYID